MLRPAIFSCALALGTTGLSAQAEGERPLARYRLDQLQQAVGLPEEQARAVVARWSLYDRDLFDKMRQTQQLRRQLNDLLLGPGTEEDKNVKVRPLLEQFLDLRRKQAELKAHFEDDIRGKLSPAQQGRLIIKVEEMQRRVAEAMRQGPGGRQGSAQRLGAGRRQELQ